MGVFTLISVKMESSQWAIRSFMWVTLAKTRKPVYVGRAS
jgi:hypothetical protein